jgi:hypothetical protein
VTSLGMPGMSKGLHAKILAFVRRKSTGTASYLGSSSEPILTCLLAVVAGVERDGFNRLGRFEVAGVALRIRRLLGEAI